MRDVRLGVKFVLVVNAALDLLQSKAIEDRGYSVEEGVGLLVGLNAPVEDLHGPRAHGIEERFARAMRRQVVQGLFVFRLSSASFIKWELLWLAN